ncbi:MAG: hypothetical protein R3240_02735, partial [Gammaproteobacteria bacterium]|nr:hypothetical protein [Gammaproteobacteria bacterium]
MAVLLALLPVSANEIAVLNPAYVKTITNPYEQYNDIHPSWSRDGEFISFERYDANKHEIILTDKNGKQLQTIAINTEASFNLDDLMGDSGPAISFNSGISWSPNNKNFVFTSNGKNNNFDLYSGMVGEIRSKRLTFHHEKDSHAAWSSDGRYIVFISSRNGVAQLYRFTVRTGEIVNLLNNNHNVFYPSWSPDSSKLAFMQEIDGVFQIYVLEDIENPSSAVRAITATNNMNLRPSWSPDGRKIAFFHYSDNSGINPVWDILMVDAENQQLINEDNKQSFLLADNVILNSETGPTWLPNTRYMAYVKNINEKYNPIYL